MIYSNTITYGILFYASKLRLTQRISRQLFNIANAAIIPDRSFLIDEATAMDGLYPYVLLEFQRFLFSLGFDSRFYVADSNGKIPTWRICIMRGEVRTHKRACYMREVTDKTKFYSEDYGRNYPRLRDYYLDVIERYYIK